MQQNKFSISSLLTKWALLSTAFLLGPLTPILAGQGHPIPIGHGQATGAPSPALPDQAPLVSLQFTLLAEADGGVRGHAKLTSADGWVKFDLTSFVVGIDGRVSAAGPATKVHGAPAFGPDSVAPHFQTVAVGETLFFSVIDNKGLGMPDTFIEGKVPSFLPPFVIEELRTIQAIIPVVGTAPESIFRKVLSGNVVIHSFLGDE